MSNGENIVHRWTPNSIYMAVFMSIIICSIEHDNDFFVIVYFCPIKAKLNFFLRVATRECILQSWSPKSVVAFQRLNSSARCRSGNEADKDPSVWHKCKAETRALDLILRFTPPPPPFSPLFANTTEVLLGQDYLSSLWYPKLLLAQLKPSYIASQILLDICDNDFPMEI